MHRMLKVPDHLIFRAPNQEGNTTSESPATANNQAAVIADQAIALPTPPPLQKGSSFFGIPECLGSMFNSIGQCPVYTYSSCGSLTSICFK